MTRQASESGDRGRIGIFTVLASVAALPLVGLSSTGFMTTSLSIRLKPSLNRQSRVLAAGLCPRVEAHSMPGSSLALKFARSAA